MIQQLNRQAQETLSRLRRETAEASFHAFCLTYLPAHFRIEPSPMHLDLFAMLQEATVQRGARLAVAAPRGHAKSTIVSQAYILWCLCYQKEPYILIISHTLEQACDHLSMIKTELLCNPLLMEDFPGVCQIDVFNGSKLPGGQFQGRWRRDEIIVANGVKITALGADKKIRGRKHNEHRPSLIILDDVENEAEVRSADQRRYKQEWFTKAVLKAGSATTNVLVVGTILHYDSLLINLIDPRKSPGWTGRRYQAVIEWSSSPELWATWEAIYGHNEQYRGRSGPPAARAFFEAQEKEMLQGTQVLWLPREDYYELMVLRISEGRASFDSEKQNEPINPDDCLFQESDFHFWDDQYESVEALLATLEEQCRMYGACDPSMGKAGRTGDDSAIVTLLLDRKTGVLYVVDADIRRRRPDRIIKDVIAYDQRRKYCRFGMEINQFQEFLAEELQRRSREQSANLPVWGIRNTTDKVGRIQRLQPMITSGGIQFSRRHVRLLEQLRQFPMGAHDDGPDALEMAVQTAAVPVWADRVGGRFNV